MPDLMPVKKLRQDSTVTLIDACGYARVPVLLISSPGEGKSSMIRGLAKSRDIPCETVLAPCREPADFLGLPVPSQEEDGQTSVVYVPPKWARTLRDAGEGIAFFDELTAAPRDTQAALLSVVLERRIGDFRLPRGVRMIAAANPAESAADVGALTPPLANRLCHVPFEQDPEDFAAGLSTGWASVPPSRAIAADDAQRAGSRAMVAGFITQRPTLMKVFPQSAAEASGAWPSPRTWTMAADVLAHLREDDTDVRAAAVYGLVGEPAGREFLTWVKDLELPSPEEVMASPNVVDWRQPRQDRTYAILQRVVAHCSRSAEMWQAAWGVLSFASEYGSPDAAGAAARVLARARPNGVVPPAAARVFGKYLEQAGRAGMGGGPEMEA